MKQEMNYSAYVDKYLDGILEREEKTQFERELRYDSDLQSELNLQKKINTMLVDADVLDLKGQLDTIYQEQYTPWIKSIKPRVLQNKRSIFRIVTLAASFVLLFSIVTLFNNKDSAESIFSEHYATPEFSMSFRSAASQVDKDLRSAMIFYENGEYTEAIMLFKKVLTEDNSRIGLNLYSGISNMEIQEYEKANENFQKIIAHNTNAFVESAEWYLGLSYLKTNEFGKAEETFEGIVNREGYFRRDARKILRRLK